MTKTKSLELTCLNYLLYKPGKNFPGGTNGRTGHSEKLDLPRQACLTASHLVVFVLCRLVFSATTDRRTDKPLVAGSDGGEPGSAYSHC